MGSGAPTAGAEIQEKKEERERREPGEERELSGERASGVHHVGRSSTVSLGGCGHPEIHHRVR